MTRICVFGAGAIGGLIGAQLCRAGEAEISLVARGPHLDAMKANGLTLKKAGEVVVVHPRLSSRAEDLGEQDYVIIALKAHALTGAIDALRPLLGPETSILFAQNGLPWWYFHHHRGRYDGHRVEAVDPGGRIWDRIGPQRALGTVVWQAAEIEAPGIVAHSYGDRMPIGEPSGETTSRVKTLSKLLTGAGIKSPVRPSIRGEIWLKLWGNLSFNPVSALTSATLEQLATDPGTHRTIRKMMEEAQAVAEALGISFPVSIEERIAMAAKVGAHRSSMLQDVEAGRATELEALLGSVIELAQLVGTASPTLRLIYDLARIRCRIA